jgi:hypothetical protein
MPMPITAMQTFIDSFAIVTNISAVRIGGRATHNPLVLRPGDDVLGILGCASRHARLDLGDDLRLVCHEKRCILEEIERRELRIALCRLV